jgi:hypothetical protein
MKDQHPAQCPVCGWWLDDQRSYQCMHDEQIAACKCGGWSHDGRGHVCPPKVVEDWGLPSWRQIDE